MAPLCQNCISISSDVDISPDTPSCFKRISVCSDGLDDAAQIAAPDVEITRRAAQLQAMQRNRVSIRSAFHRLPPEICIEIFSFYLSDTKRVSTRATGSEKRYADPATPLFLGKICAAWREIVWSSPQLWSTVDVVLCDNYFPSQVALLRDWLARSGNCRLDICISTTLDYFWNGPYIASDIVNIIIPYSKRWHSVDLFFPFECLRDINFQAGDLPNLATLALKVGAYPGSYPTELVLDPITAFGLAGPQLRDVIIHVPASPYMLILPWDQLTTFYGESFYITECFELLRQASNLVNCTFDDIRKHGEINPVFTVPVCLRHLQSLILRLSEGHEAALQLLDYITVPTLHNMEFVGSEGSFPVAEFLNMLHRSSNSLLRLSIQDLTTYDTDMIRCLRSMPALVELDINCIISTSIGTHQDKLFLHNLTSFVVCCEYSLAFTHILDTIAAPALCNLTLKTDGYMLPLTPLLEFLSRSRCPLHSFTICGMQFDDTAILRQCFQQVPSLAELRLDCIATTNSQLSNSIIQMLHHDDGLLPNLETLHYWHLTTVNGKLLTDMLFSRWKPQVPAKLRSVKILSEGLDCDDDSDEVVDRLRWMSTDGIELSVTAAGVRLI